MIGSIGLAFLAGLFSALSPRVRPLRLLACGHIGAIYTARCNDEPLGYEYASRDLRVGSRDPMECLDAGGDENTYRRLLADLAHSLRIITRRGLEWAHRSTADAEDIVQEILIAVHQKRHTWDAAQPLGPWVRAIARHKLVDALRRRLGTRDVCIDDLSNELAAPEPKLAGRDVARLTERRTARQREVVLAVAVQGSSTHEVATRLSMTDVAVRVTLHRGLAALSALVRGRD